MQNPHSVNPHIHKRVEIFAISQKGGSRFSCKMRVSRTREGTLLSVMMYRFCSNNTLYSASLSFTIFIFRFKSQITIFFSNLSLLMYIKCWCIYVLLIKKTSNIALQFSKHKETFPHLFIFVFLLHFIGATLSKKCV